MGKLDSFVSRQPSRDIRVPDLPDLGRLIKEHGLVRGAQLFGEQALRWKQELEQQLRQLAPEEPTPASTPATTTTSTPTSTADTAARASIADHIAQTSVHGAVGNVVGENNEQALEKKTIGATDPRTGKFTAMFGRLTVPVGETVTVPGGYFMIVPSGFYIDGTLVVEGSLTIV